MSPLETAPRRRGRCALVLAALALAAAAGGFSAYQWQASRAGELRPDLEFRDLDGAPHRLSEWDGKLLLVNFWATWCAPCLKEIPLLVEAQQRHGAQGFQIVGVAMDDPEPVRQFAERLRVNYPIMVGEAEVAAAMDRLGDRLGAFPFSVLIDRDGRILERVSGDLSREELQDWIDRYLR